MPKAVIILFPGTNRETDMLHALQLAGFETEILFCQHTQLPHNTDLVVLPGGFSYGDYLRSGAIAARTAIIPALREFVASGGKLLGVCNGFQILCEIGLLPGALMHNHTGRFLCTSVDLEVVHNRSDFTKNYSHSQVIHIPIAHGEGNYFADSDTIKSLEDNNQIVFRYRDNPNGSLHNIAGIINQQGNVLGMMPHPENHVDRFHKNCDGLSLFQSLAC